MGKKKEAKAASKRMLLMNGPNLDMLGIREPGVYGTSTLADIERGVREYGEAHGVRIDCYQSNSEGSLVKRIHKARGVYDGIVYNPGAHTHYSYALRDAVGSIDVPVVEVHLSNVDDREPFRRVSVIAPACAAQVKGRGPQGYRDAIDILLEGVTGRLGEGYESRYPAGEVIVVGREAAGGDAAAEHEEAAEREEAGAPEAAVPAPADASALVQPGAAARRIEGLRAACAKDGIDSFLVRGTSNIAWLTAFDGVFDDEAAHALLVMPHEAVLHTDSRYSAAARIAALGGPVEVDDSRTGHAAFAAGALAGRVFASGEAADDSTGEPAGRPSAEALVLGIEDSMALADFRALEKAFDEGARKPQIKETAGVVLGLRAVKSPSEVARMRAAQAITDAAFAHIVGFMRPGLTEREVQIELEDYLRRHGAEGLAFPSIVAAGPNGASPHAIPGSTKLEAGQCVVLDFGARAFGYCSDMTRTVFVGQPDARLRDAYAAILAANEQVESALKPGVTGAAMHELAEAVLAEAGFAGRMGHGLGHGVGMDIHEEPVLAPRNTLPLQPGNVVTVEPGVYLPGEFGMRLEDFGVVTDDGFEVFTQSTHDMVVV